MQKRILPCLLAAVLSAGSLLALEIEGPERVELKSPAWYSVSGSTDGLSVVWLPLQGAELQSGPPHIRDGHALFWAAEEGTYQVNAIAVNFEARSVELLTRVVVVGGGEPGPDPPPPPPPGPVKDLTILVVEESSERTAEQFKTLSYSPLLKWLETNGHRLRIVDKDVMDETSGVPPDLAPWLSRVGALPYVFCLDDKKRILNQGGLPTTGAKLLELAKKHGAEK